jgi:Zn-dependent peptidase ImmA (M78 family)
MTVQVPYLAEHDIECAAELLLAQSGQSHVVGARQISVENIVEKYLQLRFDFDDLHEILEIPKSGPNPDIFGALWASRREIVIDQSLDPDEKPGTEGRYRYTLAHEAAHWWLHRPYLIENGDQPSMIERSARPAVVCRSSQSKQRIEWQADFFASCLLMPRNSVLAAWRREFGSRKITYELVKHLPEAHPPHLPGLRPIRLQVRSMLQEHGYLFDRIARHFAPMFEVSVQAMRIRLEKLDLLRRELPREKSAVTGA